MAVVLGIVQGVTEFLPISSDGHLALAYHAFGAKPDLAFEIFLHYATLLAMLVYFRRDIVEIVAALFSRHEDRKGPRRLALVIVVATVASGVLALALRDIVEPLAANLAAVGVFFLVTAAALAASEWWLTRRQ